MPPDKGHRTSLSETMPPLDPKLLEERGSGETPSQRIVDALHGHVARLLQAA
jgi:hypothetical protein